MYPHGWVVILSCGLIAVATGHICAASASSPTFAADVGPLLQIRCSKCHTKKAKGQFSVNSLQLVLDGGKSGKAVIPGNSGNSLLYKMVSIQPDVKRMPRKGEVLSREDLEMIRNWIDQGAK